MASLEEIKRLAKIDAERIQAEKEDATAPKALPPRGGSVAGDFSQGVARGALGSVELMSMSPMFSQMQGATTILRPLVDRFAPEVPDSVSGRYGERFGAGLPFLPAGGATGMGAKGVAGLVAEEIVASGAGQALEEAGFGGGAQFAGELAVGILNPFSAIGRGSKRAAPEVPAAVKKLAKKLGISERTVMRAGLFHRAEDIEINPKTGEPDLEPVLARLESAVEDFPDPNARITTRQAMSIGEDSQLVREPVGIAMREKALARQDTKFRNRLAGRKNAVARQIEEEFENFLPNGTYAQAQGGYKAAFDASAEEAAENWRRVDLGSMPTISTKRLKDAANEVLQRVGEDHPEHVPAAVRKILEMPDEIPVSRLQTFRSGELLAQRAGSRATADTGAFTRAKNSGPIMEALRREVMELPDKGSPQYRKALAATRRHYEVFDGQSVASKVMNSVDDQRRAVQTIRRDAQSVKEVRKLKRAFEGNPEAWEGFQRAVIDELADEELGNASLGSMVRTLRQKADFYKEVLGPEKYGQMNKVLRKLRRGTAGFEGTAASAERTGSGMNRIGATIRGLSAVMTGGMTGAAEAAEIVSQLGKRIDDMALSKELMHEFMLDPETALIVLKAPDPGSLSIWAGAYDMLVSRALTRRAVQKAPGAAARSFGPNEREQPRN